MSAKKTETSLARIPRTLKLLILGSILLPAAVFIGAAWLSYHRHTSQAEGSLYQTRDLILEHAVKVFEVQDLVTFYVDEILFERDNANIRLNEQMLHARIGALSASLSQLQAIWVFDENGAPLVSSNDYPAPAINVADRDYFTQHRNHGGIVTYISEVLTSRQRNTPFFQISRRRSTAKGEFTGIVTVSVRPSYFNEYYARLRGDTAVTATLVRADGEILARYPNTHGAQKLPSHMGLLPAIAEAPVSGLYRVTSSFDGRDRLIAYHRVGDRPVYVTAGMSLDDVYGAWREEMAQHLVFGAPATAAMFMLSILVALRSRNQREALAQLQDETRRREASEDQLRQMVKMEAVGRLTGGIAHDFNNLLTAIGGNIETLLRRLPKDADKLQRPAKAAQEATQRAATLTHRLLAFSRQQPLEMKVVDVNRLVDGMSELMFRTLGEATEIKTVLAGDLWKTNADPHQLENALLNLAINAHDAMPGGGHVTIETANACLGGDDTLAQGDDVTPGQYVMLAVSDTGTGISPDILSRVFDPFFTTKPQGKGTGLGLSMVYGFVKQSGGHVKIVSEVGHGTTIKVYLPRIDTQEPAISTAGSADTESQAPRAGASGITILMVEDDTHVMRFGADSLRELGYDVIEATDGKAALEVIGSARPIDLLFTDVILPGGMNGRELADEALKARPSLKVLFTTGYARDAIVHHGKLDAGVDLLNKPFSFSALARKVKAVMLRDAPKV